MVVSAPPKKGYISGQNQVGVVSLSHSAGEDVVCTGYY